MFSNPMQQGMFIGEQSVPSDIKSLITATGGLITTLAGPNVIYSAAEGQVPDGLGGVQASTSAPVHSAGYYGGPAYTNLFTGGPTAPEAKLLTAQKYCLQCVDGSVDAGAYGTATPSAPLTFTASAGSQTFTPTGCTAWMLSAAGGYVYPSIPPGQSVVSTVGTTAGNGVSVPLTGSDAAEALKDCFEGLNGNDAVGTVALLVKVGAGSAELANPTYVNCYSHGTIGGNGIQYYKDSQGRPSAGFDGTNYINTNGEWARGEYHIKVMEFSGAKFRVGHQRFNEGGTAIDANIVWSHSTLSTGGTFDGSFNPTTFLRWFLNVAVPNHMRCHFVGNQAGLGDAEITRRIRKYGQF